MKGNVYASTLRYFEQHVPGGVATLHREIKDPRLLGFIQQPFDAQAWYDVLPMARLIKLEARAVGDSITEYMRARSRFQAIHDLKAYFADDMKVISSEMMALQLPSMLASVFDFCTGEAIPRGPGHVETVIRGFPEILVEWYLTGLSVYIEAALHASGAARCTCRLREPEAAGERHGVALVDLHTDVLWR
jgi:hypothetical protein